VTRLANARRLAAAMRLFRSRRALEFGPRADLERHQVVHDRDGLHVRLELRSGGAEVADRVATLVRDGLARSGADVRPRVEIVERLADDGPSGKFRLIESRV
jgi:hypothetical protein